MGLLSGFEKFQVNPEKGLFDQQEKKKEEPKTVAAPMAEPKEEDFLLDKTVRCIVCDRTFKNKVVKANSLKRLDTDFDLRPNHAYIDTLKYGVCSCPHCGYTALNRYFEHIGPGQMKLIRENICANFSSKEDYSEPTYSYEQAIERYKFAIANAVIKRAKASEIAYAALNIAWLERTYIPIMPTETDFDKQEKEAMIAEQKEAYEEAYTGFLKAIAEETYPIAGMDQNTLDFLIANMAYELKHIDVASRFIAGILQSRTASAKIKDRALEMKTQILAAMKK